VQLDRLDDTDPLKLKSDFQKVLKAGPITNIRKQRWKRRGRGRTSPPQKEVFSFVVRLRPSK
jgi:hypothetical protein